MVHPKVQAYIDGVLSGGIIAGRMVKLAVQRHVRDLERSKTDPEWPYRFDEDEAADPITYCQFVRHSKGEWAGKPFDPEPWECFIDWCVFGWQRRSDGTRRFRMAYVEVARKNGKSTYSAKTGLYLTQADNEPGAEVYTAATKREQARIVHGEAVRMVQSSPSLKKKIGVFRDILSVTKTNSKFVPLGQDSNTEDGLNPHGAIIDEFHAHPDRGMLDVIETATGARRQPLIFIITTAGNDEDTPCFEMHEHGIKVLEGGDKYKDDELFVYIAALDEGDDPWNPAVWPKANPNWGISVKTEDFAAKARSAQQLASARNSFLQKRLNVWVQTTTAWINMDKWDACESPIDPESLAGRECYGGMDLASKLDLTAFSLLFPPQDEGEPYKVLSWFWIPESIAESRHKQYRIEYPDWIAKGFIEATPGDVTDYDFIERRIVELAAKYAVRDIAYDPWNATHVATHLKDHHGIEMVEFRQGMVSMNEPSKEFERLVQNKGIAHDGNPVSRWHVSNVAVKTDEGGNIKPVKPKHGERKKIDFVVTAIMALGRAMLQPSSDLIVEVF